MKKILITSSFLMIFGVLSFGQSTDQMLTKCISNAGNEAKYLKDYRIQLGKASQQGDLRYKANISLWKDMKYRFSLCNADDSKGQLILKVKDETNKVVLASFDQKSGKTYELVDFLCSKSGIYQLCYDFVNEEQGSGIAVVSLIK